MSQAVNDALARFAPSKELLPVSHFSNEASARSAARKLASRSVASRNTARQRRARLKLARTP